MKVLRLVMPVVVAIAAGLAVHWLFGSVTHALQALRLVSGA